MNIAWLDLRHHMLRFVLTAVGLGLLFTAMIGMVGLYRGVVYEALAIIRSIGADIWITQGGRAGPFAEETEISAALERRALGVPGVVWARKFIEFNRQYRIGDRRLQMGVVGLDYPEDTGSWVPLVQGRHLYSGHYEMLADRSLGFDLGSTLRIGRDDYTVVGVTAGQVDMAGDGLMFVAIGDAQTIKNEASSEAILLRRANLPETDPVKRVSNTVAAVMVKLQFDTDIGQVKTFVQNWGDVSVYSKDEQEEILLNSRLWRLRLQILSFVVMTFLVTLIVAGLAIYTLTLEKTHQIALLKLIGARDRFIVWMILQQALLIGAAAFADALAVSHVFFPHFPRTVLLLRNDLAIEGISALALCAAASWFGIRKALRVRAQDVLS
jgi:putative ABC transport system permease protein